MIESLKKQIAFAKRTMKSENSGYMEGYLCALTAVEGMVAEIEEKNGWIPVKDGRPPESDGWYITTYDGSKYNEDEHSSLIQKIGAEDESLDRVHDLTSTDWQNYEICRDNGVSFVSVYRGGLYCLSQIDKSKLPWRRKGGEFGKLEYLTLGEIYEAVPKICRMRIITVIVNDPLKSIIFQCGNYEEGKWIKLGEVMGYA